MENKIQLKSICVYCGSRNGRDPSYLSKAEEFGKIMADQKITLIYGGGNVGIMGHIADSVLSNHGKVIGIIPTNLVEAELAHQQLTELIIVDSLHERKLKMFELSDAFIAFPGGFGTLDEFCEMMTWAQLHLHDKPCILANIGGYYDKFIDFINHAVEEDFVTKVNRSKLLVVSSIEEIIPAITACI